MCCFKTGRELERRKGLKIHEYGIIHGSVVLMVHRVLGGFDPRAEARKKKCNLTDFQNQIETTSEPCMISLDDDLLRNFYRHLQPKHALPSTLRRSLASVSTHKRILKPSSQHPLVPIRVRLRNSDDRCRSFPNLLSQ